MNIPPYFKQETNHTCSLAVLRMILFQKRLKVTEKELLEKIKKDYPKKLRNIWNPTIAKLACEYQIKTLLSANWPLLKKEIFPKALADFKNNPEKMDFLKYENPKDDTNVLAPLPLAYKEVFLAVEAGCKTAYGGLTEDRLKKFLRENLILTTVRTHLLYPEKKARLHSVLIYEFKNGKIFYHDPFWGESLNCSISHFLKSIPPNGAFIAFEA